MEPMNTLRKYIYLFYSEWGSSPWIISFALSLIFSACTNEDKSQNKTQRPNVIFIMSDDHTSQAVSAYGGRLSKISPTSNIDRLADEGMLFKNCFVTNSICTPSRAAIMTGKYAHKNGVYKFTALDQTQPTLPKVMQADGYQTAFVGKYHLHSNPVGLDYFSILPGQGDYHNPEFIEKGNEHLSGWVQQGEKIQYEGHSSDIIATKALDFLENEISDDQPFMLFCHFKAPHDTWDYAARYEDFLADVEIPEPDNLFDDYEGRSDALKTQLQFIGSKWGDHTNFEEQTADLKGKAKREKQYQLYMKKYLRCVRGVDDNVGRILDYLDESGLAENTIVMYTGDQGFYLGEHGLYDKRFMYEEGLRMPFLVRWPGEVEQGSTSDGMILNVDFAPTILEAVGLSALEGTQGKSFVPLLSGDIPTDWRTSMYYRYYYSHFETEPHFGIRTYDHKLIYYDKIDQWEFYDLNKDRAEMINQYNNPAHQRIVSDLKEELSSLQIDLEDDPKDDGSNPNIGVLSARPLFQTLDVSLGLQDISVLMKFRTKVGGTLFSKCRIGDIPWSVDFELNGIKTLFLREGDLIFNDGWDDDTELRIAQNMADGQLHTVAMIVDNGVVNFYVDGKLKLTGTKLLSEDNAKHTFNIGAGIDFTGYQGYNFIGEISSCLVYNKSLNEKEVREFNKGSISSDKQILNWQN